MTTAANAIGSCLRTIPCSYIIIDIILFSDGGMRVMQMRWSFAHSAGESCGVVRLVAIGGDVTAVG